MPIVGGCQCGAVRYEVDGEPVSLGVCHCRDCQRAAGAPMVAWAVMPFTAVRVIEGATKIHASSPGVERHFCADCGTGLFYRNAEHLPDQIDVQTATLDDPEALAPEKHVQTAERISWAARLHELPEFERWPR